MNPIRNAAKAIIQRDGMVLFIKGRDERGIFYALPGGGQNPGENITDALKRECMEEIGVNVVPKDILYVRDYIGKNHEFSESDSHIHQIEYMFECSLPPNEEPKVGEVPDTYQIGIEWLPIGRLAEYLIYPKHLAEYLLSEDARVYMGDVN